MGRVWIVLAVTLAGQQPALADLTLPPTAICRPTPASFVREENNRIRSGLWGNLPINTNPWLGTDRAIIIELYERLFGLPRVPDGPIFSLQELATFRNQLADDVEEGYAAFYDDGHLSVYALTMRASIPESNRRGARPNPDAVWFTAERTVGVIVGATRDCREVLVRHLQQIGATMGK